MIQNDDWSKIENCNLNYSYLNKILNLLTLPKLNIGLKKKDQTYLSKVIYFFAFFLSFYFFFPSFCWIKKLWKKKKPDTEKIEASSNQAEHGNIAAQTFNFRELAAATKNFRQECLLGEGGFGRVYKGTLQATGQVLFTSYTF